VNEAAVLPIAANAAFIKTFFIQTYSNVSHTLPATGLAPTSCGMYCTKMTGPAPVMEGKITEWTLETRIPRLSDSTPAAMIGWKIEPLAGSRVTVARSEEQGGLV
jgi:hypothetical protein